jgi:DNA-directed RNA polymerase beta' subunit
MDTINYYPSDTTIGGLLFSNYTSEEIRRLSVKELTSSQAIDRLGAPVSGGPYDLALGPFDKNDRCFTCGQGFVACPGHLGHISLVLPVYNPVFFRNLVNVNKIHSNFSEKISFLRFFVVVVFIVIQFNVQMPRNIYLVCKCFI